MIYKYIHIYNPTLLVQDLMTPPLTPLGVENVKFRENSEKIRGPPGSLRDPLQPFQAPKKIFGAIRALKTGQPNDPYSHFSAPQPAQPQRSAPQPALRDPRRSPDFFRIFPNFHIFDTQGGEGVIRSYTRKLPNIFILLGQPVLNEQFGSFLTFLTDQ